jgi:hypothetical protein
MPLAGLLEAMMAGKFEWQFKYRDEGAVNARAPRQSPNPESHRFAGTSANRQTRFTVGFWEIDNHRARRRRHVAGQQDLALRPQPGKARVAPTP